MRQLQVPAILAFLMLPIKGLGQDEDALIGNGLAWGVRAGISISDFGSSQPHLHPKSGFYVGGVVQYTPTNWVSILVKPGYNQYGGIISYFEDEARYYPDTNDDLDVPIESETPIEIPVGREIRSYSTNGLVTLHAIELPISARFGYDLERARIFINSGLVVSYHPLATERFERTQLNTELFITTNGLRNNTSAYQAFQGGLIGGVGVLFPAGAESRMAIEINYQRGLTPIRRAFSYVGIHSISGDLFADSLTIGLEFMF